MQELRTVCSKLGCGLCQGHVVPCDPRRLLSIAGEDAPQACALGPVASIPGAALLSTPKRRLKVLLTALARAAGSLTTAVTSTVTTAARPSPHAEAWANASAISGASSRASTHPSTLARRLSSAPTPTGRRKST